jgi:hypothetical protein
VSLVFVLPFTLVDFTMANFHVPVIGPLLASELFDKSYTSMFAECTEAAYDELCGLLFGVFCDVGNQQTIDTLVLAFSRVRIARSTHTCND